MSVCHQKYEMFNAKIVVNMRTL